MWGRVLWVLDWLGRVQTAIWIKVGLGGVIVSGVAALMQASPLNILLLFIAGCLVGLGVLTAYQNYHLLNANEPQAIETTPELSIEFEEGDRFLHQGQKEGHGLKEGEWWTYRFLVKTTRPLQNVQAYASAVKNELNHFPFKLSGTPIPRLYFDDGSLSITLSPGPGRLVDLFAHFREFWNPHIWLGGRHGIQLDGGLYDVEVTITANELQQPTMRRFRIGTRSDPGGFSTLIMTPLQ